MYSRHATRKNLLLACSIFFSLGYCIPNAVKPTLPGALSRNDSLSIFYPPGRPLSTLIPFHIPSTNLYLHVRFPRTNAHRHPLSQYSIGGVLALANDTLNQYISEDGADALVDWLNPEGTRQQFVEVLSHEVVFGFLGLTGGPSITWGQVRDVVRGLYLYMVVGRRFWEAELQVTQGSRFAGLIGVGKIFKPVDS